MRHTLLLQHCNLRIQLDTTQVAQLAPVIQSMYSPSSKQKWHMHSGHRRYVRPRGGRAWAVLGVLVVFAVHFSHGLSRALFGVVGVFCGAMRGCSHAAVSSGLPVCCVCMIPGYLANRSAPDYSRPTAKEILRALCTLLRRRRRVSICLTWECCR